MPVWLRNLQSKVQFNAPLLKLQCGLLLHLLRVGRYDVSVVCMDSEGIRNLNNVYRNVDASTDVLAFPYHEVRGAGRGCGDHDVCNSFHQNLAPGELPRAERECDFNLGDVVLGMPVVKEECEGVKLEHRLPVIVTHGLCHLLGYRHDTMPQRQLVTGTL